MKLYKIKELSRDEMIKKLFDLKKELFFLKHKRALQQIEKPLDIRNISRDVRRLETIIREKANVG